MYLRQKAQIRNQLADVVFEAIELKRQIAFVKAKIIQLEKCKKDFTSKTDLDYLNNHIQQFKNCLREQTRALDATKTHIASLEFQARPAAALLYQINHPKK